MSESKDSKRENVLLVVNTCSPISTFQGFDGTPLRTQSDFNYEIEKNKARIMLLEAMNSVFK